MNKKYWLIIIFSAIIIIGVLYWYLDYQPTETAPTTSIEKATETDEAVDKNIKSIKLEKPPFIKD